MKSKKIYQIHISLLGFKPKIWRRILIPADLLLSDFHYVIQEAMGWTNSHLHQFIVDGTFYTDKMEEDDFWDDLGQVDYEGIKVNQLLKTEKGQMIYEYDFGDGWQHHILLEKILDSNPAEFLPICLAGKMNCPPEDCGGVHGYASYLKILEDSSDEEYESVLEWMGEDFDPEHFSLEETNHRLKHPTVGDE